MILEQGTNNILDRLQELHPKQIDLSLGRIKNLMTRLGSPQNTLPPVIHIAGTNGKGSTIAFLRAMLEAAGLRVHVYTSPHLVNFVERIVLAGDVISENNLNQVLADCERANAGQAITFFEITTAAAFLAFASVPADAVILETGLGGRLDATNIIEKPVLTAITPISMDHMHFLGNSLSKIAAEKAAIQKRNVPSVVAAQQKITQKVLSAQARKVGTDIFLYGRDWHITMETDSFVYQSSKRHLTLPKPSLYGAHQLINAGCAVACLEKFSIFNITEKAMRHGLINTIWPGRLDRLRKGRLVTSLPDDWELWLDGGHNAGAGEALGQTLLDWNEKPTHLIVGMLETKQVHDFLAPLVNQAKSMHMIEIPDEPNTAKASSLASAAQALGVHTAISNNVLAAISDIIAKEKVPSRILVCGSLYLLGHVYNLNI